MRIICIIFLAILFFFWRCEKQDILNTPFMHVIDTAILSMDTLEISFGYFGDEEGAAIVTYPKHAKSCELLNKQWEERIFQYIPEDCFRGIDTSIIVTYRGSDGASPPAKIDTTLIRIKVD